MDLILSQLHNVNFLVVGDLLLDRYLWGEAKRVSPEAPVPIVHVEREESRLGGAANVANNLYALGVKTQVVGLIGKDQPGRSLQNLLKKTGIDTDGLVVDTQRITTVKTRVMASHQQLLRFDHETHQVTNDIISQQLWQRVQQALDTVDGVLVSDYKKGTISQKLFANLVTDCQKKDIPLFVDPKGQDYRCYRGASCLTPNEQEAAIASNLAGTNTLPDIANTPQDLNHKNSESLTAAKKLMQETNSEALCITLGARGVLVLTANGEHRQLATETKEVFDVTGAGDTFIAVLAAMQTTYRKTNQKLKKGKLAKEDSASSWFEAATWANRAAGMVVGRLGAVTISSEELARGSYGSYPATEKLPLWQNKLRYDVKQLAAELNQHQQRGKQIVFTNGCFDLLHAGHAACLESARREGDLLVVGLNSDASVRRLKGDLRPLSKLEDRVRLLCSLTAVDYVTVFDADTPQELIAKLRPDVLVKGQDYALDEIVGGQLVKRWGGRVVRVPFLEGHSSSQLRESWQVASAADKKT